MICTLPVALSVPATAQELVATTFGELRFKVKDGDTVFLTGDDRTEREAKIVKLSASSLVVSIGTTRSELTEDHVRQIRQRVPDPLGNGAGVGALVAAGGMMLVASQLEGSVALTGLIYGGLGALVGMGIDAANQGKATIYESRRSARSIVVAPILGPRTQGVSFGLRF
jgi:hypothetical protein